MREAMALNAAMAGAAGGGASTSTTTAAATAVKPAALARDGRVASTPSGAEHDDDEDEAPYLMFNGETDCRLDAALKIDERIEGSFNDVQGVVPFSTVARAEGHERDAVVCPLIQAVLDTRDGRVWTQVLPALRGVPGTSTRTERGRQPQRHEGLRTPAWHEAQDWLVQRLNRLDGAGSDRLERKLPGGHLDLRLRWSFKPA